MVPNLKGILRGMEIGIDAFVKYYLFNTSSAQSVIDKAKEYLKSAVAYSGISLKMVIDKYLFDTDRILRKDRFEYKKITRYQYQRNRKRSHKF